MRPRTILAVTFVAALVVFAAVQDRVTASGARQYVALQRAAIEGGVPSVTIEQVMTPAVSMSVRQALLWSLVVLAGGGALSWFLVPGSGRGPHE
jgi:hypothetical protein